MSWEQVLNLPPIPGLICGFLGSFLIVAAGYFVGVGFRERPPNWSWGKKILFVTAGALLGALFALYAAVKGVKTVDWATLGADWSNMLNYTLAGAGWPYVAMSLKSAAQALANARQKGKNAALVALKALIETADKEKTGGTPGGGSNA